MSDDDNATRDDDATRADQAAGPSQVRHSQFSVRTLLFVTLAALVLTSIAALTLQVRFNDGAAGMMALGIVASVLILGQFVRRRYQLGMRAMLIIFTLVAIVCGLVGSRAYRARQQRVIVQAIMAEGGRVGYDYEDGANSQNWFRTRGGLIVPRWLERTLGRDMFGEVAFVYLAGPTINDKTLRELKFDGIPQIDFRGAALTDDSLFVLAKYPRLKLLGVAATRITNDGLQHLGEHLTLLDLSYTKITDMGLPHLDRLKASQDSTYGNAISPTSPSSG